MTAAATTGSGPALLLTGGRAYPGHWQRPHATGPTKWLDTFGRDMHLQPGNTWVLLVPINGSVSVS